MSDSIKLWIFILLLPVFAAVGHDFHANFLADEKKQRQFENLQFDPSEYMASDFGYLFFTYTPEFYDNTRASVDPVIWDKYVEPVLQQYTWVVAFAPLALFLIGVLLSKMIRLPSMPRKAKAGNNDPFLKHEKQDTFKYKRR